MLLRATLFCLIFAVSQFATAIPSSSNSAGTQSSPASQSTNPAAIKAADEGDILFQQKKYPAARGKFTRALQLDPLWAEAALLVGDTWFMEGNMAQAEQQFRRATELAPRYSAAWRFLSDTLNRQNRPAEAYTALLGALAAMPGEKETWKRLRQMASPSTAPLGTFNLIQRVSATASTITMNIDVPVPKSDHVAWTLYGTHLSAEMEKPGSTPFEQEYAAWESTLRLIAESPKKITLTELGLRDMQGFYKGRQLKAAMFTVLYREAYRPEFEAWKRAEPEGIKHFIDTFHIGL